MAAQRSKDAGFTIIETLIVLAIAGLILMIVFLAIPTLQRNSRNNQRKQEVQQILQAVSHYELNNTGAFPGPCGDGGSDPLCNASPNEPLLYTPLHFYDDTTAGNVMILPESAGATVSNPNSIDKVAVYNYQKCSTTSQGDPTSFGAGYNDVVALYTIETGTGGTAKQCQQL